MKLSLVLFALLGLAACSHESMMSEGQRVDGVTLAPVPPPDQPEAPGIGGVGMPPPLVPEAPPPAE